jgi:FecR protein
MATGEGEDKVTAELAAELSTLASYVEALPSGAPPAHDDGTRRRRIVPRLRAHAAREHLRARRRRLIRRTSLIVTALGGAAVALVMASGSWMRPRAPGRAGATIAVLDGTLWLEEGAARRTLSAGEASGVVASDELESPAERVARVQLSDTATLTLGAASRVGTVLVAANAPEAAPTFEAVKLVRGRAHLQVRKLHGGQRFHVLTPDADVQVRGTEFDVELIEPRWGSVPTTCVRVQEGLVAVVSGGQTNLVAPGQTWGCPREAAAVAPAAAPPPVVEPPHVPEIAVRAPERRLASRPTPSDLRLQNGLFQQALEAERAGRYDDAAQLYRRLLARAPRGPLSSQARANLAVVSRPR